MCDVDWIDETEGEARKQWLCTLMLERVLFVLGLLFSFVSPAFVGRRSLLLWLVLRLRLSFFLFCASPFSVGPDRFLLLLPHTHAPTHKPLTLSLPLYHRSAPPTAAAATTTAEGPPAVEEVHEHARGAPVDGAVLQELCVRERVFINT